MLQLTDIPSIEGDASIAMIRGQPRMGYELTFKLELSGVDETYFQDFQCVVEVTELCDDGGDPEDVGVEMVKMLDTDQSGVAKDVIGYGNACDKLLKIIHKLLKEFPWRSSQM